MKENQYQIFRKCLSLNLQTYIEAYNGQKMSDAKLKAALKVFDENTRKVNALDTAQNNFVIETSVDEINSVTGYITALKKLSKRYSQNKNVRDAETLEGIKVEMTQYLEPLCEISDKISADYHYLKIILDSIRGEVEEHLKTEKTSVTLIPHIVKKDERYKYYSFQYANIEKSYRKIYGAYRFYKDLWEQIKNSVATAKNLKHRSDQTNN